MNFGIFRRPVTIERQAEGEFINGIWVGGEPEEVAIQASIQPTTPKDLESLPEGRRQAASYRLYTDTKLLSVEEEGKNPDVAIIDGERFEIAKVWNWQNGIISHYKALAVREMTNGD